MHTPPFSPPVQRAIFPRAAARLAPDARPAPADSLALRQLLTSKQAEALEAAQWWALYYTNPVRPAPTAQATSAPAPPVARSAGSGAVFALYPNPAHRTLSVRYAPALAAKGSAPAEVRLVDLLGGAVRQRTALTGETTAVSLVGLKPGTYACQLYVGGVLQSSQRVVIE